MSEEGTRILGSDQVVVKEESATIDLPQEDSAKAAETVSIEKSDSSVDSND